MAKRKYTGYDKTASGKREGFETLVDLLEAHFSLWNNGTFGVRDMRGKPGKPSVHATGRAGDLSWRGAPYRGTGNYDDASRMMDFLVEHADELGVEAVFDYYPRPWGRGWKCDRGEWQNYTKKAFSGAPLGDWVHVEISNQHADDPQYYIDFFEKTLGKVTTVKAPEKKTGTAPAGKTPWLQRGSKGEEVKKVQSVVGAVADGVFDAQTEQAVKAWQASKDLHVDGIIGPSSWQHVVDDYANLTSGAPAPDLHTEAKDSLAYPGTPVKVGDRSESVKPVQAKVGSKVDGWFGPATKRRVMQWQRNNDLIVDGIVGPKTWAAMFG
jgi:hypothetical protein